MAKTTTEKKTGLENKRAETSKTEGSNTQKSKPTYKIKKDLPLSMEIPVVNGYQGTLVYKSSKTGERLLWESFGCSQDMELGELKNAKNSKKGYFEKNWFLIDDPEVLEFLGVSGFYKNSLKLSDFDKIFKKSPGEILDIISKIPEAQKRAVAYRAKQLIETGDIDSMKVISTIENALNIQLIEK